MKDLEEIYIENFLAPVRSINRTGSTAPSIQDKIIKIQGLFGSIKLGLQQLKHDMEGLESDDNGFAATIDIIDQKLENPYAIFDSTFFKNKDRFN